MDEKPENPFQSPIATAKASNGPQTSLNDKARTHFQTAVLICLVAPVFEYLRFIFASGDTRLFVVGVLFGLAGLAIFVPLTWYFGLTAIKVTSIIFHGIVGRRVPIALWQNATLSSLWTLPVAACLGVVTWLTYSLGDFGGWPASAIFGTVGNAIGAWCYGTIFWSWFKLKRQNNWGTKLDCP